MSQLKKHVLAFSPNGGKLFALVDEQGILRIWDTELNTLKQEYTPNLHLSGPCTAITWVAVTTDTSSKAKKSRKSQQIKPSTAETLYIALGTLKGNVCLYSLAEGKIERTLKGETHNGPITAIAYDNAGLLYTAGVDCQVLVWSIAEERRVNAWQVGPEKPQSIVYMPKSKTLAVGSRQLKVFDVTTGELLQTFTGHTTEINTMCSLVSNNNDEYAITTSKMERIICFWKIEKKGRNKPSTCTLLMEDLAYCLTCEVRNDGQVRVASVTRNGNIHIYLLNTESFSAEKFIKPKVSLQIASDDTDIVEPLHAIAAHFDHDATRSQQILFGYGSSTILQFERFTLNYAEKLNVIVRADPKKLHSKKQRNRNDLPGSAAALKTQTPVVHIKNVEYNSGLPSSKKKVQNEIPMEARLQNLKIHADQLGGKLQTQSKTQLLMQALHSKDETMLQAVLNTTDPEAIRLTLNRLPPEYVNPLVSELSQLMQGKNSNVTCALRWLPVLISTHTSVMMSEDKDELRDQLGVCLGIAEQRLHCLTEALQISGRVNLILNQMKRNANDHLNESNALIIDDEDNVEGTPSESNWSDLEEYKNTVNDIEADDDIAFDDVDIAMTQDEADSGDGNDDDDDDEEETDSDHSAG